MSNVIKPQAFAQMMEATFNKIRELSRLKGGEYAGDHDRLANFRRNGVALALPAEAIWAVYAAKHWDAIIQYCSDVTHQVARERGEPVEGRIDDLILYLMLFKAMVRDRQGIELDSPTSHA